MSQAEELLNGLSEEIPVHGHPVPDTDTYFIIDPITRKIENTNRKKNVVMQYDHNSERFTFELPRYIDGHDMLECTSVTVNVDNIEVVEIEGDGVEEVESRINSDAPDMTDLRVHPTDSEKVITSWLISRNSTQLAGILSFHIEFKCVDANGNVVYEWSTDNYDEITVKARKKNGEAAVAQHADLLEQWRTRIFGAVDSVMANIAAEGEAQVAVVKAESEIQQEAVELKGAQTLDSIPEEYTEVDAMAEEAVRSKGDAIVCEVAGESIVLKDSSNDHIRGLKLFGKSTQKTTTGKNLLQHSLGVGSHTIKGITFEIREDGSVLCNGAATNPATLSFEQYNLTEDIIVSGCPANGSTQTYRITIDAYKDDAYVRTEFDLGSSITIHKDRADYVKINIYFYTGIVANGLVFYPMIRLASVVDDTYEPYTGGKPAPNPDYSQEIASIENPSISVCGKNLLNNVRYTTTQDGVTFTVKDDKSVVLNGTAEQDIYFYLTDDTLLAPGIYNLSGSPEGSSTSTYYMYVYPDYHSDQHGSGFTFEVKETTVYSARIYVKKDTICNNVVFKPQIERGSKTTTYEPYAGGSIDITHTLPGIPVTSGGNYTDSDGQQWICDEVDLDRGVYVQRVGIKDFDGSDDEDWGGVSEVTDNMRSWITVQGACRPESDTANGIMCSQFMPQVSMNKGAFYQNRDRFFFGSGMTLNEWKTHLQSKPLQLVYVPSTPIETPLTAEEITAFKALRTNYPNTTILNDAGAWMSVKYNADTKTYVENPKTLKLVDTSTGVVYELKIVNGTITINPV